jgi:hypothetical protein
MRYMNPPFRWWTGLSQRLRILLGALALALVVAVAAVVTGALASGGAPEAIPGRPGAVLLVPGYGGSTTSLDELAARIRASGRTAVQRVAEAVGEAGFEFGEAVQAWHSRHPLGEVLRGHSGLPHLRRGLTHSRSTGSAPGAHPAAGPAPSHVPGRTWHAARTHALGPAAAATALARRPYDLRHAALSLWLNADAAPAQIAQRPGHSITMLLAVYTHCIDGQADITNRQIEDLAASAQSL